MKTLSGISGPLALGIHWAHDASAAICSPDGIVCAVAEERITRIKHHYGFPKRAIETVLDYAGVTAADIDVFAFSTSKVLFPSHRSTLVVQADGTCAPPAVRSVAEAATARARGAAKSLISRASGGGTARPSGSQRSIGPEFADRLPAAYEGFLADIGLMDERIPYYYVAHHRAHAASAFRLSGTPESCVITSDGKGDALSGTIYHGHPDGRMDLIRSTSATNSLGSFYQAITEALGFIPVDGEYKTMGLAAYGHDDGSPNPFDGIVTVVDGEYRSTMPWEFRDYNAHNPTRRVNNPLGSVAQSDSFAPLLDDLSREQFSFFAQQVCEQNLLAYARDAIRLTGVRHLSAAGGVMLNVKANQLIQDELQPDGFFVFPDASDSGLAAGAALEALHHMGHIKGPLSFGSPYLGHDFEDAEIESAVLRYTAEHGLKLVDAGERTPAILTDALCQGRVVGTFQGRLEMGPRALGNRSVLADPRSVAVKDRINLLLKGREPFVPFAPMVLEEDAHLYWDGHINYPHMTFSVTATPLARETVPVVVHVDGTMRPQVVSDTSNPWVARVLREFKSRTGVGVLVNTSFNRHGHAIVGSPEDALDHLVKGWVDALCIGRFYLERADAAAT